LSKNFELAEVLPFVSASIGPAIDPTTMDHGVLPTATEPGRLRLPENGDFWGKNWRSKARKMVHGLEETGWKHS